MAKIKNAPKKEQKKTVKIPAAAPKPAEKTTEKPAAKKEETVEDAQVIATAMNPERILNRSGRRGSLSPDATVRALDLAHRVFVEERDPDLQFPKDTAIKVNKIVAVGILCTLADHSVNGEDSFAAVLNTQAYPSLVAAAEEIGFKLPDIKALPAGTAEGTVMIPAKDVTIPEETKAAIKKEDEIRKGAVPELDPEKITSEEDLRKALEYKFLQKSYKIVDTLTDGIDFMKRFRLHEASLAENADDAKKKFESYNSGDWLDDLFHYIKPSIFFSGIGKGMATVAAIEKNPVHAFVIFRDAVRDKNTGEPVLNDQELAYCVRSIVTWCCNTNIESNKKAIENLDAKKNAAEIEACKKQIEYYTNILDYISSPSYDEIDNLLKNIGSKFDESGTLTPECQNANKTFNLICKTYYGKPLSTTDYNNLASNIQQYGGHIINLFRSPGTESPEYSLNKIADLKERSEEEKAELIKELKKAYAERKKEQKASETKNA